MTVSAEWEPEAPEPEHRRSVSLRSVSLVTILSFGQMFVLFGLQLILARVFGASRELDCYLSAGTIPLVISGIVASAVGSVIIRMYGEQSALHSPKAADQWAAGAGVAVILLMGTAGLLVALFAEPLIRLCFGGFTGDDVRQTAHLLRIQAWLIPLNTGIGVLHSFMHARQQFLMPALTGIVGPLVTIAAFLTVGDRSNSSLAWAGVWGAVAGVVCLLPWCPRPDLHSLSAVLQSRRRFLTLIAPLILGAAYARLDIMVDRPLADQLPAGNISQLNYAMRITAAVATLFTSGLSIVVFPSLVRCAAVSDHTGLQKHLDESWRFLTVVLTPAMAGLIFCGRPMIHTLFEHGEFTARDSDAVGWLLMLYCGLIAGSAIGEVCCRTFYALGRNWLPTMVGMLGFTLGTTAKFFCVVPFGASGLVAATSGYYLINAVIFLVLIRSAGIQTDARKLARSVLRAVAATTAAIAPAALIMAQPTTTRVCCGLVTAVAVYLIILSATGDEFAQRIFRGIAGRNRSHKPSSSTDPGEPSP
ncbi:MAG: oligosaccharide flippase family protein [Planctomycetaceae bacterium]|nr:oligosaccharide flippase family protein [Planctomycetaceae bacterium]